MLDLIIKNGTLIDGSGDTRYTGDVGIRQDKIVQIGALTDTEARRVIDAQGKIVAPGFVDVHDHSDGWLLNTPHFISKTSQGFTTEVLMADGISYAPVNAHTARQWIYYLRSLNGLQLAEYQGWESVADYMALLDGRTVQNSIAHIPYANVRTLVCGFGRSGPDDYQMRQIKAEIERGMAEGAVGLSTGLDYIVQCFATTAELVEACRAMAGVQGLYVTHIRYKKGVLAGLKEAVEIGRRAGVPVHISHLKAGSEAETEEVLTYIDSVARQEVDFSFDVYPYMPISTMLNSLVPYEVWADDPFGVVNHLKDPQLRTRFAHSPLLPDLDKTYIGWLPSTANSPYIGQNLRTYVEATGHPPADALCDLLIEEGLAVLMVVRSGEESLLAPFLQHPCYMMGSDGIYQPDGVIHPRQYGSAPRLLGPCVRDHGWFSLEDAVYKLSGYPAERFGLKNRGLLEEGYFADLVVFEADTVTDRATYDAPQQLAAGIEDVLVNGVPIIRAGQPVADLVEPLPGRALRFGG